MAGQDLLDQRGTRPRQTDDEHGPPGLEPGVRQSLEQGRLERLDQLRDEPLVLGRIVHHVSPLKLGEREGVGLARALGRLGDNAGAHPRRLPGRRKG